MVVNTAEHVLLLPVSLNHLIESHNPTKKVKLKRPKRMNYTWDLATLAVCIE